MGVKEIDTGRTQPLPNPLRIRICKFSDKEREKGGGQSD